jgi:hypothetical protein
MKASKTTESERTRSGAPVLFENLISRNLL